jgi:hypothetical protein
MYQYDVTTISKQMEKGSTIGHTNKDYANALFCAEGTMHNILGAAFGRRTKI